jgi:hypothetical protein
MTFAGGYLYSMLARDKNVTVKDIAGPLAVAIVIGVLASRARYGRHISPSRQIVAAVILPVVAFCTFFVTYLVISTFRIEHKPIVDLAVFVLAFIPVIVIVRWSVHLLCGLKKPS